VLAAIVGAVLHFSTSESDRLAAAREQRLVAMAIEQSVIAVANDQEASTYWDDAVLRTRERPLDLQWIDNNLGVWFYTYYQFDEAYLLDSRNAPIYAMQDGRRVQPGSFARVAAPALGLARELRRKIVGGYETKPGAAGKTIGTWELTMVGGRPALVSLKPIVSETGNVAQAAGSEYLHVAVRYLDGNFLDRMTRLYGIDRPRFSWRDPGSPSFVLRRHDGRVLGYITWKPFKPGEQVEDWMTPVLIVALSVVGALIGLLLLRIRRSRRDLEASRAKAHYLAFHDSLTGLPNRALLEERLERALGRKAGRTAILLLDLDRFKNVNDTLGHQAGDTLIRVFGQRLSSLLRERDTVARVGGDEFAILIEGARLPQIHQLAQRIIKEISQPFDICAAQVYVGVSIGIAVAEQAGDRLELVRKADIALYRAKDGGRNTYRLFSADMDDSIKLRCTIEEELRGAVSTGRGLTLHYQPEVNADGTMIGLEALLRWQSRDHGLVTPDQFISVAEETGLIVELGNWVLREACLASLSWPGLFVAVNLSPVQFHSNRFFEELMRIVRTTGADPRSIQLEVTERVLLEDDESVRTILAKLRKAGFRIVLDDFGTGYSSLSYLRKFQVDKIKIDGSFVQHLSDSQDSRAIVSAVLALGEAMGVVVAAEGVESADQLRMLRIAGCKEMQGHYFSAALPAEDVAPLIGSRPLRAAA
jgi:diguanylate cyclase (GGDEF)-like protein